MLDLQEGKPFSWYVLWSPGTNGVPIISLLVLLGKGSNYMSCLLPLGTRSRTVGSGLHSSLPLGRGLGDPGLVYLLPLDCLLPLDGGLGDTWSGSYYGPGGGPGVARSSSLSTVGGRIETHRAYWYHQCRWREPVCCCLLWGGGWVGPLGSALATPADVLTCCCWHIRVLCFGPPGSTVGRSGPLLVGGCGEWGGLTLPNSTVAITGG